MTNFWFLMTSPKASSQATVWCWFGQSALRIFLITLDLQTKVTNMKKPRNRFKLSINLEKVRYEVRHYKTYKGRIEKNTRTTLPEKYFKFVVHLQTIGMIPVDNLLLEFNWNWNSYQQTNWFSSVVVVVLCFFTREVCSGSWRTSRGSQGSGTSWHTALGWRDPGEKYICINVYCMHVCMQHWTDPGEKYSWHHIRANYDESISIFHGHRF